MIEPVGINSELVTKTAMELGGVLQNANAKSNKFIEDMLGLKADQLQSSAASEAGVGDNVNMYA